MFDLHVTGGMVLDGTGAPARPLDVGVEGGRVRLIPRDAAPVFEAPQPAPSRPEALRRIDAAGLVVCPGFIDVHSHSDISLLTLPGLHDKVRQGVTTEVIGNCGISAFPVRAGADRAGAYRGPDLRAGHGAAREVLAAIAPGDFTLDWDGAGGYFDTARRAGLDANVVALVGHGSLRAAVIGLEDRPATEDELEEMAGLLGACLEQGAAGLSLGLLYPPGCYADRAELGRLAAVVARAGGVVASHMRDYEHDLLASLEEMYTVARDSGVRVEISHLMAGNLAAAEAALASIDRAVSRGLDVSFDQYPYERGMTSLQTLLPPWMLAGGNAAMLASLGSSEARERAACDMAAGLGGWDSLVRSAGWGNIAFIEPAGHPWSGRSFDDIASAAGRPAAECLFDLLLEVGGGGSISMKLTDDAVLRLLMRSGRQCFGTDGVPREGLTHPRTFGTYPRVLGFYVRDQRVLDLPDAIRRCTSEPARRFGLAGRGILADGAHADIVVFNPQTVADGGTYRKTAAPTGIAHVFVGGRAVVEDGRATGVKAGSFISGRLAP